MAKRNDLDWPKAAIMWTVSIGVPLGAVLYNHDWRLLYFLLPISTIGVLRGFMWLFRVA
jgi:hypothetical protein